MAQKALARGRYVGSPLLLALAKARRHQASQRTHCMRSKPPQLLPTHRPFNRISAMMINSTCFTHRRVPHPRMIYFYTETRPLRARYSNDEEEEEWQSQSWYWPFNMFLYPIREYGMLSRFNSSQPGLFSAIGSPLTANPSLSHFAIIGGIAFSRP